MSNTLEPVKINRLEIENVKRVKAVKLEPAANGLTVIGGKNGQGKTSVLDSIAWVLGGDRFRPSQAERDGSIIPPYLHIVMNNGLVVERKGKNSELKVIDPEGRKGGQQLLNEFVEQLALDLPKFMQSSSKDKANTLLQIIGVGDKLFELERQETELYSQRHAIGQIADQKRKFAQEMTYHPDAPREPISASELIKKQQDILACNGENQRKRERADSLRVKAASLKEQLEKLQTEYNTVLADLVTANKSAADLQDESTAELEASITQIESINARVRTNLDKEKAEEDALAYQDQYAELTGKLDTVRQAKVDLLNGADLPLEGLSVDSGELTYNGYKWDNMSSSDQLKVSTAIVRKLKPQCGFVLLDKLEQMDVDTLNEFGKWLERENLQAIATRVSVGGECSILIEDGYVVDEDQSVSETKQWKEGVF